MVGYRGCGMECIVGEDFNMECGIYLEEENICFRGWVLEETARDSLSSPPAGGEKSGEIKCGSIVVGRSAASEANKL